MQEREDVHDRDGEGKHCDGRHSTGWHRGKNEQGADSVLLECRLGGSGVAGAGGTEEGRRGRVRKGFACNCEEAEMYLAYDGDPQKCSELR